MGEGKILFSILSLTLYSEDTVIWILASDSCKFGYYSDRLFSGDGLDPQNAEQV